MRRGVGRDKPSETVIAKKVQVKRTRKTLFLLATVLMLFTGMTVARAADTSEFMDGSGTASDPYLISNTTHLANVANYPNAHFLLVRDLTYSGQLVTSFNGVFDGDGHTISGLNCNAFIDTLSGEIRNLILDGTFSYGAFAGEIAAGGRVSGCRSAGQVTGATAGGIAGSCAGVIELCSNEAVITAQIYGGGLVGTLTGAGLVDRSYNIGTVTNKLITDNKYHHIGGIVGTGGQTQNSFNLGMVICSTDTVRAGGIFGYNSKAVNCYNAGAVRGKYSGGIAGETNVWGDVAMDSMVDCYYLDNVKYSSGFRLGGEAYRRTMKQLQQQSTYQKFDFDQVWEMDAGDYGLPVLQDNPLRGFGENTTEFAGGEGTMYAPYKISTAEHLANVTLYPDRYFQVINDITMPDTNWTALCPDGFCGVFDGGGYTLTGLYFYQYDNTSDGEQIESGLFADNLGTIRNVTLSDVYISARASGQSVDSYVGAMAAKTTGGRFENCHVTDGTLSAEVYYSSYWGGSVYYEAGDAIAGGLCGHGEGEFFNCSNGANVTAYSQAGGICGDGGTFTDCSNSGSIYVNGKSYTFSSNYIYAGGIAARGSGDITRCTNSGAVEAYNSSDEKCPTAGGIVGSLSSLDKAISITACRNTGVVKAHSLCSKQTADTYYRGPNPYAGGIVGYNDETIRQCINSGEVSALTQYAAPYAGGIAGYGGTITDCVNTADIAIDSDYHYELENISYMGGVAGEADTVTTCYSVASWPFGDSNDDDKFYRSSGTVATANTVTNCYFLTEYASIYDEGLSAEAMLTKDAYEGFDFDAVWGFDSFSDYPYAVPLSTFHEVTEISLGNQNEALWETVEGVWPNLSGQQVLLKDANGNERSITMEKWMLPDLDVKEIGTQTVSVWYPNMYSEETLTIVVREKSISSIEVKSRPYVLYRQYKDDLYLDGGVLIVNYNNGTYIEVDLEEAVASGFDNTKAGEQIVTLSYGGCSTSISVTIAALSKVYAEVSPYYLVQGEPMQVYITEEYDTGDMIEGNSADAVVLYDSAAVGLVPVTVTYQGLTATTNCYVYPRKLESAMLIEPNKLSYLQGEDLDLTGGYLEAVFSADSSEFSKSYTTRIPLAPEMISGYDKFAVSYDDTTQFYKATNQIVTVNYEGFTGDFLVRVKPAISYALGVQEEQGNETMSVEILLDEAVDAEKLHFLVTTYRDGQMLECQTVIADKNQCLKTEFTQVEPNDEIYLFVLDSLYCPYLPKWTVNLNWMD